MRIGIVGLGRAGSVHLEAARATPGVEVSAICDPAPAAQEIAARHGLPGYDEVEALLDAERIDAVAICAPPCDHARLAVACMERGRHVLCEKPLALDPTDARWMFATARRRGVLLTVASKFRHLPEIARVRDLVRCGALGDPLSFDLSFCAASDMSQRWNALPEMGGGGVISDNGPHVFDVATFLFGGLESVHATVLHPLQKLPVEDSAHLRFVTSGAVMGTSSLSWSVAAPDDRYLLIHGSRGSVSVGWRGAAAKFHGTNGNEWQPIGGSYDKGAAHRAMYAAFRDALRLGRELWIQPDECLQITAAVRAAYQSVVSDSWQAIALRCERLPGARDQARADAAA